MISLSQGRQQEGLRLTHERLSFLCLPDESGRRVSWDEFAARGALALVVFAVLFALAHFRWKGRKKHESEKEQRDDAGLG